jgi:DNA polymerase III subunit delta
LENVTDAVLNVARYDVFQLPIAMLAGDAARIGKTMAGLQAEGEAIPLVLWAITEELRTLLRVKAQVDAGRPFSAAARENRLWGPREKLAERALARLSVDTLSRALQRAADIDRLAKGLRAPEADADAWLELTQMALAVARR